MALGFVREDWKGRRSSIDDKFVRTAKRVFRVRTVDPLIGAPTVRQLTGIPRIWDIHPEDDGVQVKSVEPEQTDDGPCHWLVNVDYSSDVTDEEKQAEDPLDRPSIASWGTKETAVSQQKDWSDDAIPVLNSAGRPFDPAPTALEYSDTLTIVRNQPDYDRDLTRRFRGAVNSDDWWGGPAGTVKCIGISATQEKENDVFFWRVTYQFECKDEVEDSVSPWLTQILNAGFEEWDAGNSRWKKITEESTGIPVSQPALLDKFGAKLAKGADPSFLNFQFFTYEEFAELNLP